jgi:cytoskeletal protein CcmA (bactofilin family)
MDIHITAADLTSQVLTRNIAGAKTLTFARDLGLVVIVGDLRIEGGLEAMPGTSIHCVGAILTRGNIAVNGDLSAIGRIEADCITSTGAIRGGENLSGAYAIEANGDISAENIIVSEDGNIACNGRLCGKGIAAQQNVHADLGIFCGGDLRAVSGDITSFAFIYVSGGVRVGGDMSAALGITVGKRIEAKGVVRANLRILTGCSCAVLPNPDEMGISGEVEGFHADAPVPERRQQNAP